MGCGVGVGCRVGVCVNASVGEGSANIMGAVGVRTGVSFITGLTQPASKTMRFMVRNLFKKDFKIFISTIKILPIFSAWVK